MQKCDTKPRLCTTSTSTLLCILGETPAAMQHGNNAPVALPTRIPAAAVVTVLYLSARVL